jgi:hypothetical protein
MGIKDEEMEGLSDEERAALEDDDDESEILGKIAGDDGSDDDEEGDDDESTSAKTDDDTKADAGVGDGGEPEGAKDDGDGQGEDDAATVSDEFRPELKVDRPEGLDEQLVSLDTQTKALLQAFKDGEIDMSEFMEQKEAIDSEKNKLVIADALASQAESQNESTREQRWKWEQERFFNQKSSEIYKDPAILAALDVVVKQVAADKANAKKPAAFFLEEADRQIRKRFNMGGDVEQVKPGNRQPDLSKVPKTLSQLPAADIAETGDVEFAYLDKLDGIALEAALRKMTPEQEARYLGAA